MPPIHPTCPECIAGKHTNCDGSAWDPEKDEIVLCECEVCNKHE